jgi:rRNA-processing protein FCF1
MKLRAHVTVAAAIAALDDALSRVAGAANPARGETMRDSFLRTHDDLETVLSNTFDRTDVIALLHTARYWHLMQSYLDPAEGRLHVVRPVNTAVSQECDALKAALTAHREAFAELSGWLALPGLLVLADTNVMIHCSPTDKIDWRATLRDHLTPGTVPRILVPLPVVDEIDRKKFESGGNTAKRAKAAIASLRALREGVRAGQAAQVQAANGSTVTLEIPRHDVGRVPLPRVDDELIDYGQFLARTGGRPVVVVTRDYGMEARANWSGLHFVWLDEKYQKDQD